MRLNPGSVSAPHPLRRALAAVAATALVATGVATGGALSASAVPASTGGLIAAPKQTTFEPGRYIVRLADDPAATYDGGVDGMSATKPDAGDQLNARRQVVQTYTDYLEGEQQDVAASVGATIEYSYTLALNGFSATLTAAQAAELASTKNVVALEKDRLQQITAQSGPEFLGLDGPDGVWAATGGQESAGEGVVLGVLDTGIAPENPSFAGEPLGTTAGSDPYYSSEGVTSFAKADGETFTGVCQTGEQFGLDDCSTKIVGARYFVNGFGLDQLGDASTGEFVSPRDGDGHGSHTGGTAVGNADVDASVDDRDFGAISGVAPAAKIAAYKVCWSGPDNAVTTDDGCASSDLVAAIDAAVADGVDVINFSIGGGAATSTVESTDLGFLNAAAAGIFVSASAGNSGPTASTLDNAAPWITTVAASTIPSYEATVELGDGQQFAGASVTVDSGEGVEPVTGPFVTSTSVALAGATTPNLCIAGSLDPALAAGKIILCERGVNDRVAKSTEVARVGGIGMVLVNVIPGSIDLDAHSVPTVHLDAQFYAAVSAYAATPGATATLVEGNETGITPPTPQVAGFSSRGPLLADGSDILKPDITAPGVAILAAGPNAEGAAPTWEFLSGTSMSAPHIAGLAVLYLGERPTASPAEVKSAMMTTAYDTVDAAGAAVTDPFVQGAGHVDPTRFFEPGLLYLNGIGDWLSYIEGAGYDVIDPAVQPIDPSNLNLASIAIGGLTASETITRTVTSTSAGSYSPTVSGLAGIDAVVEPEVLNFDAAGQSQSYTITFTRTDAPVDTFTTGALDWEDSSTGTVVHSPIAIQPLSILAPANAEGTGVDGSVDITVTPGADGDIPLSNSGLSVGVLQPDPSGVETEHSGSGVTDDQFQYTVVVPEGSTFARFDLDAIDDTTDLDLTVELLDAAGVPVGGYQSATGSADERVDVPDPDAGTYLVTVDVYTAPTATAFDLTTFAIAPATGAPLVLTPDVIAGVQGTPATFTASWTGLEPFSSYLAQIGYGETGVSTLLEVTTQEAAQPDAPVNTSPPTITGTPKVGKKLTATPGEWNVEGLEFAYQWQADGVDIAGATAKKYRVASGDQGKQLTVVVTATAADLPPGSASSAGVTVSYESTTSLSLSRTVLFSWQRVTASATVDTIAETAPAGKVDFRVNGKSVGQVQVAAGSTGTVTLQLPKLRAGVYGVQARFIPDDSAVVSGSTSSTRFAWVVF